MCDLLSCSLAIIVPAHSIFYTLMLMLRTLTREAPGVQIALSLHAPTQQLRNIIVPRWVDNICTQSVCF